MAKAGWGKDRGGRAARVWAGALVIGFVVVAAVRSDKEAGAFAAITAVAAALTLLRGGMIGRLALGLAAIVTLAFMVPAALANISDGEQFVDILVPAALASLAVALLLVVVGVPPAPVLVLGVALLAGTVVVGVIAPSTSTFTADALIKAKNVAFNTDSVEVPAGGVIAVKNGDLFWHTFTVDDLGIDVAVPTGATRRVVIPATASGTYRFKCAIPGHESAGMKGTLTVTE